MKMTPTQFNWPQVLATSPDYKMINNAYCITCGCLLESAKWDLEPGEGLTMKDQKQIMCEECLGWLFPYEYERTDWR